MNSRLTHSIMGVYVGMFIVIWHQWLPAALAWAFMVVALVLMVAISQWCDREAARTGEVGEGSAPAPPRRL